MFEKCDDMNYSGHVKFKNASGRIFEHSFHLSAEQHRNRLSYEEEKTKTHHQLQRIPEELRKLNFEVKKLRTFLEGR